MRRSTRSAAAAALWCLAGLSAMPAAAGVSVDIDAATLNVLLSAVAVDRVEVPLGNQGTMTVELHDLSVTGFEPPSPEHADGAILTRVRVVAPELGLDVPLEPRIAVRVVREGETALLELRFEDLGLRLPLLGSVNLASLVPPMRYPADNVWLLAGSRGDVPVTSRLSGIKMGRETIRFLFDIDVASGP